MRGKVAKEIPVSVGAGITPASAGKSRISCKRAIQSRDHPRKCGEKQNILQESHTVKGSPPQVRGKVCAIWNYRQQRRITPASAGKSPQEREEAEEHWDHPRKCGEKLELRGVFLSLMGSPPQVRGKVQIT